MAGNAEIYFQKLQEYKETYDKIWEALDKLYELHGEGLTKPPGNNPLYFYAAVNGTPFLTMLTAAKEIEAAILIGKKTFSTVAEVDHYMKLDSFEKKAEFASRFMPKQQ